MSTERRGGREREERGKRPVPSILGKGMFLKK